MIIWGSGVETKDFGVVETKYCNTCEKDRPFKIFVQYKYSHFYYVFSWISGKKYFFLCNVCRRGVQLDSKKVESKLQKSPIPFYRRYGWTFLVGIIALAVTWGIYTSQIEARSDYSYIHSPRANDLYVADLSKLINNLGNSPMYAVMRIKAVNGDRVEFFVAKVGYPKTSGPGKDISSGKAWSNEYYYPEPMVLRVSELKDLRDNNVIKSIRRN
jgi:hypothetical protein